MSRNKLTPDHDPHDLLTTLEAARLVRRSPQTVIRWILHDGLAAVRVKGRYLISKTALLQMMQQAASVRPATPGVVTLPPTPEELAAARRHRLI